MLLPDQIIRVLVNIRNSLAIYGPLESLIMGHLLEIIEFESALDVSNVSIEVLFS